MAEREEDLFGGLLSEEHQKLLQVFMSRGCISLTELREIMADIRQADVEQDGVNEFLHEINQAMDVFGFSIRGVAHDGEDYIGFVNQVDDEAARAHGSTLSTSDLETVRVILRHLSAVESADLHELHRALADDAPSVRLSQIDLSRLLKKLQNLHYLAAADARADEQDRYGWVIGPRAHLELSGLLAEYYEGVGRQAGALPQVLFY